MLLCTLLAYAYTTLSLIIILVSFYEKCLYFHTEKFTLLLYVTYSICVYVIKDKLLKNTFITVLFMFHFVVLWKNYTRRRRKRRRETSVQLPRLVFILQGITHIFMYPIHVPIDVWALLQVGLLSLNSHFLHYDFFMRTSNWKQWTKSIHSSNQKVSFWFRNSREREKELCATN
jgi:hypothetical protein